MFFGIDVSVVDVLYFFHMLSTKKKNSDKRDTEQYDNIYLGKL